MVILQFGLVFRAARPVGQAFGLPAVCVCQGP
jgi:hypothetical protein